MKKHNLECLMDRLGHLDLTEQILLGIGAPPYLICLLPAVDRLAYLIERFPAAFIGLDLPSPEDLREWTSQARRDISQWPQELRSFGKHLNKSGQEASLRANGAIQHPLKGFGLWSWGCYAGLLITKPYSSSSSLLDLGFDQTSAWVIGIAIRYNLAAGIDDYWERTTRIDDNKAAKSDIDVLRARVVAASQGLIRLQALQGPMWLFEELSQDKNDADSIAHSLSDLISNLHNKKSTGIDPKEHIKTNSALQEIVRLLLQKVRKQVVESQSEDEDEAEAEAALSEMLSLQNEHQLERKSRTDIDDFESLPSLLGRSSYPTFLPTIIIEYPPDHDEAPDDSLCVATEEDIQTAEDFDVAIEEILEQSGYQVDELDYDEQEQDEATLRALSVNSADFTRRLAERQPTRISYVGLDARVALRSYLRIKMGTSGVSGAAAILLATSWMLGRDVYELTGQLVLLDKDFDVETLDADRSVALDPWRKKIWVRIQRSPAYENNSPDARPIRAWVAFNDFIDINKFVSPLEMHALASEDLASELANTLVEIKGLFSISDRQLKSMILDTLIEIEGHDCTAVLIASSPKKKEKQSGPVNLHYLSPHAKTVVSAYEKAAKLMVNVRLVNESTKLFEVDGDYFVGSHMCPTDELVKNTILQLSAYSVVPGDWRKAHNQITLATQMLLAFAIGARDSIAFNPNAFEVLQGGVSHYLEKSEMRVVVFAPLLQKQLQLYDKHMAVLTKIWMAETGKSDMSENLFFLFDEHGNPSTFHPKSFTAYLSEFGIEYLCPLNGLRRLLLTHLFGHGKFGPLLDIYLGHAVDGRRPWAMLSGIQLKGLHEIANFIEEFLQSMNWPLVKGCSHAIATAS